MIRKTLAKSMMRSRSAWLWGIFILLEYVFGTGSAVAASAKKGVGTWYFPSVENALRDVNISWYYTWEPQTTSITKPGAVEFVPMIRDERYVTPDYLARAKKSGGVLLGFNEPDHTEQSNMTVQQALDFWPDLMATGMRLGSPATAGNPSVSESWLDKFMEGAEARGYRVDFVCVHWYGGMFDPARAVKSLEDFLHAAYRRFRLPIWLTEYSLIRWSDPPSYPSWHQQAKFASESIAMLEPLTFVERYAWFSLPPFTQDDHQTISLYQQNGDRTPTGSAYRRGGLIRRHRIPNRVR